MGPAYLQHHLKLVAHVSDAGRSTVVSGGQDLGLDRLQDLVIKNLAIGAEADWALRGGDRVVSKPTPSLLPPTHISRQEGQHNATCKSSENMVGTSKLVDGIASGGAGTDGCNVAEDAGLTDEDSGGQSGVDALNISLGEGERLLRSALLFPHHLGLPACAAWVSLRQRRAGDFAQSAAE